MRDDTLALFAAYMKKVLSNARIDYIRKMNAICKHEVMAGKAYEDEVAQLVADERSPLEQIISDKRAVDPYETICVSKWKELVDISLMMMYNVKNATKVPRTRKGLTNGLTIGHKG